VGLDEIGAEVCDGHAVSLPLASGIVIPVTIRLDSPFPPPPLGSLR